MKNIVQKQSLTTLLVAFVLGLISSVFLAKAFLPMLLVNEFKSPLPFERTLSMIEANAIEAGLDVPKEWQADRRQQYKMLTGIDIGANGLLTACDPKLGAALLKEDRYKVLSVLLPCSIAVYRKKDGRTYVATLNVEFLSFAFGGKAGESLKEFAPLLERITHLK
ncbi:MAG: DUF302 domain-containing protein [Gammaproteobacteria bacterium]|nr:DUF302 domain-containing protein [Gammaproteobacteria bacterium]